MRRPQSGVVWLRRSAITRETLQGLAHGRIPCSHAALDALGADRAVEYLRCLLVRYGVLPPRDRRLADLQRWADIKLGGVGNAEHRQVLGHDLGVAGTSTDEVYDAMDWLLGRQDDIEGQLARRHLRQGGMALFDLSSSWVEGSHCELAVFGHSRDGKRGKQQIEYGLLAARDGCPVAVRVFAGNTGDPKTFTEAVEVVRDTFGITEAVMVGDRG
jgi:hypothetical protein